MAKPPSSSDCRRIPGGCRSVARPLDFVERGATVWSVTDGTPDRVLTLRELNRATLARQILLERRRMSPISVIEHLVGMQAQAPQAPYIGIWTRTTTFRRQTLERALETTPSSRRR